MLHFLIYPEATLFTLLFILYSKWQFSEERGESQGRWHTPGFWMRVTVFVIALSLSLWPAHWADILLAAAINAPLWDIGINVIALQKVGPWYVGLTAKTDRKLGNRKWLIYAVIVLGATAIRVFFS